VLHAGHRHEEPRVGSGDCSVNAKLEVTAPELVNIEIDGVALTAPKGAMIIQAADDAGIHIPRFCYHKKLPIAANCRMCLVEVEKMPKAVPACATPVAEGMKISTRSEKARAAQRAVMEFLLINHPLDCPICDQGGECELQDVALGYGRDVSRYCERKRVVKDKDIGPLIATDMTRCIHCTRCIRTLDLLGGEHELGAMGRGENTQIGTYVERSITSEMSGNVIDVCPVGALTSKPFRYTARAWELVEHATVAPHDSMGSNIYVHTRRNQVMRVVPRENEQINEVWISDRDRFSYQGLHSADRLRTPMIKEHGVWRETDWDTALRMAAGGLNKIVSGYGPEQLGLLVSPTATLEEMYLLSRLARGMKCANLDHRLRQCDFADQAVAPVYPWLGQAIEDLEQVDAVLLIGSNVRKEQPIAAHRLRKASLRGAQLMCVNPRDFKFNFEVDEKVIADPAGMVNALAAIARAVLDTRGADLNLPKALANLLVAAEVSPTERAIAERLCAAGRGTVLLGNLAAVHPAFSTLRALAGLIAEASDTVLGYLPEAGNSVGGWLAGVLPHRTAGGRPAESTGLDARAMVEEPRKAYLLFGVEPEYDCFNPSVARAAVEAAEFVVVMAPFFTDAMKQYADVVLPIAYFTETSGTFVNAEGRWQSFAGAVTPPGEARPGWKVLRVLGNMLELSGFDYVSSEQVRDELARAVEGLQPDNKVSFETPIAALPANTGGLMRVGDVPIYAVDGLVRRATALQQTPDMQAAQSVAVGSALAQRLKLDVGVQVTVRQGGACAVFPVMIDDGVPDGCVWVPVGLSGSAELGPLFGPVELEKA